jgi:hypothetical protein
MTDWSDKQYFLNTVYERFFQGYSVKLADTMGIVYTPQEIVDFMCASVAEVLEKEFGKKLWSDDVYIIDPCTGTGNYASVPGSSLGPHYPEAPASSNRRVIASSGDGFPEKYRQSIPACGRPIPSAIIVCNPEGRLYFMPTTYLFRVDMAKDNDEFFAAILPSAAHAYAGLDLRVGTAGWVPDLVRVVVQDSTDSCCLTLIELEAIESVALISCRKFLPESEVDPESWTGGGAAIKRDRGEGLIVAGCGCCPS